MKVLELPVARSTSEDLRPPPPTEMSATLLRLAPALTGAAAVGGVFEVLLERVAGPILTHAAGPSLAPAAAMVSGLGTIVVGATAILVLLAALAWSGAAWSRSRIVATGILAAAVTTLAAGLSGDDLILALLYLSVAVTAITTVAVLRLPGIYGIAVAAVAVSIVASQWSLAGWTGHVSARVVGEAALVLALVMFAASVAPTATRRSVMGLIVGALIAAALLMAPHTPLVALWASGATLWMPSVVYIGGGAAVGLLLATWLPDRTTRHLAAGLALLAIAGIEPTLIHHNLTALVALVALATPGIWSHR